ncbi:hypothetical protein JCM21900_006673 [Sporobolomyces salmonicolor]
MATYDVFDYATIRSALQGGTTGNSVSPPSTLVTQAWVMLAFCIVIILCTLSGVGWRKWKGTGWFYVREESGLVRPSAGVMVQVLLGEPVPSGFLATLSGYLTTTYLSPGYFGLQTLSFLLPLLALHHLVWAVSILPAYSTLLEPFPSRPTLADSWGMSTLLLRRKKRAEATRLNAVAAAGLGLAVGAVAVAVGFLVAEWTAAQDVVGQAVRYVDGAQAADAPTSTTTLAGFAVMQRTGARQVRRDMRVAIAAYLGYLTLCLLIYIPALTRLLFTLDHLRFALRRAIVRLRTLAELANVREAPQLPPLEFDHDLKNRASEAGTTELEGTLAEGRKGELEERLKGTEALWRTVIFQACVAVALSGAYYPLLVISFYFSPSPFPLFIFTLWSGWTFAPLALLCSLVFAYRSFFGSLPPAPTSFARYSRARGDTVAGSRWTDDRQHHDPSGRCSLRSRKSSYGSAAFLVSDPSRPPYLYPDPYPGPYTYPPPTASTAPSFQSGPFVSAPTSPAAVAAPQRRGSAATRARERSIKRKSPPSLLEFPPGEDALGRMEAAEFTGRC